MVGLATIDPVFGLLGATAELMPLIRESELVNDEYTDVSAQGHIPGSGAVIVSLDQWQSHRQSLIERADPVGLRLQSSEHPEAVAEDVGHLALIALEFPTFRDGRAYSYARLLRDRYGFSGELRAVGEVLLEQIHFMSRVGFNAFEVESDTPVADFETAQRDFSVWYQPSSDGHATAIQLRHSGKASS